MRFFFHLLFYLCIASIQINADKNIPILNEFQKLKPSIISSTKKFGGSVAINDNIIVISSSQNDSIINTVTVYVKNSSGFFHEIATLVPSDNAVDRIFGQDLAINNNVIVIGAPAKPSSQNTIGAVYLYKKPKNGWKGTLYESTMFTPRDNSDLSYFGHSIDIENDTLIVGAPKTWWGMIPKGNTSGTIYVYEKALNGWENTKREITKLQANKQVQFTDAFANNNIVINNNTIIAGNYFDNTVFVFEKPKTGWQDYSNKDTKQLIPSNSYQSTYFAWNIDLDNDTIAVTGADKAYIFEKPKTGWQKINIENAQLKYPTTIIKLPNITIKNNIVTVGYISQNIVASMYIKPAYGWKNIIMQNKNLVCPHKDLSFFQPTLADDKYTTVVGLPENNVVCIYKKDTIRSQIPIFLMLFL